MPFKRQKSNVSPHYHDTRTLLRKYRDVIWNLEVSDLDLQEEFKAEYGLSTDALFVDSEVNKSGNRLENYARALERSKKMMQIIDTAIDLMRRKHKKGRVLLLDFILRLSLPAAVRECGCNFAVARNQGHLHFSAHLLCPPG